jgi:hypothetical protein
MGCGLKTPALGCGFQTLTDAPELDRWKRSSFALSWERGIDCEREEESDSKGEKRREIESERWGDTVE